MTTELLLYTRKDCCLCEEMKKVIGHVTERFPTVLNEVDIDSARDLQEKYGHEIPVLFINGRKAFKYRVTARELVRRLNTEGGAK